MKVEEIAHICMGPDCPADSPGLGQLVGELALHVKALQKQVDQLLRWQEEETKHGNGNGG